MASSPGNWDNPTTWGGQPVPTAGESVTINSGITVTVNIVGAACASITFAPNSVNSILNIIGINSLTVSGDISFSNPTIDSRSQTVSVAAGSLTCANVAFANTSATSRINSLTISTGTLSVTSNISMPGATNQNTLVCSGTSNITIGGDFTGIGKFTQSTSNVIFNGAAAQSIRAAAFSKLEINKPSGIVSLAGAVTVSGRLTLTSGNLDLNAGALTVGSIVGSSSITANGAAARILSIGGDNTSTVFTGIIQNGAQAVALTKTGTGTLTLSALNTYTGTTSIGTGGALKLGIANSLSDLTPVSVTGTLDLNGFDETIGSLAGAGAVTSSVAGNVTLTTGGNATLTTSLTTFSGIASNGSGVVSITKTGIGIMILSGLSTYTGLTTVNAGTLTLGAAGVGPNTPLGTVAGGTVVNTGAALNVNGVTLSTNEPLTLNGTGIASAGALYNGSASLPASYSGLITLGSSASIVATRAAIGLNITNSGTIIGAGFGLTLGGAGNGIFSSVLGTASGTLTKVGAGIWTLPSTNLHTGGTTLSLGTLNINNSQALGDVAGTFTIISGTLNNTSGNSVTTSDYPLAFNGSVTFTGTNNLNLGSGAIVLNANTTITVANRILTMGGALTGSTFDLIKSGVGILTLTNNYWNLNALAITAGTFNSTSGTLALTGNFSNVAVFNHNSGTIAFTGSIAQTLTGTASQTFNKLVVNKSLGLTVVTTTTLTVDSYTQTLGNFRYPATFNVTGNILLSAGTLTSGGTLNLTGNWENNGAVFVPGTGTVNFIGTSQAIVGTATSSFNTIVISSGRTLTGPVGNLNVAGNFTNNGGTYIPGSGTITFNGTTAQAINGTTTTQTFNNLTVNKSLALTAPATLVIGGSLSLTLGSLTAGTSISAGGNWTTTAGTFTAGTGTVVFNGTDQSIVTTVANSFNNLTIDPGSTVTAPTAMNIGGNFIINGNFAHNNGTITFTGITAAVNSNTNALSLYNVVLNKTVANSLSFGGSLVTLTTNNYTQTNGNFTGPNALTVNGNAVFTAGTFTAGTSTTVNGNWTKAVAAIFTPGLNTVTFSGIGTQSIGGTSTSQIFYNLVVNKTASTLLNVTASTVALTVNNLTLTQGNFTAPATLTINGDALLTQGTFTAGTSILARSNWTNNGGSFVPGLNTLSFTGTGAQQISGTSSPQVFYNVTVNKTALSLLTVSAGEMRVNNFIETQGNFTAPAVFNIDGALTLNAGTFTAGATIYAYTNWTNNSSFIHNNGKVIFNGIAAQTIAGSSATSFYDFEVSNASAIVSVNTNINVANTLKMTGTATQLNPAIAVIINAGAPAGTISGNGTVRITRTSVTADYLTQYRFLTNTLNSMTLNFTGLGAQTVNGGVGDIGALTLSTSGVKTLPGTALNILGDFTFSGTASGTAASSLSIGGNVVLGTGTVFSGGAFVHNVTGNWTNNGGTFTSATSTINFNNINASQSINGTAATQTFFNITLANVGQTTSLGGNTTALNIGGSWVNNGGTFAGGTSVVSFTGAGRTISGSSPTAFPSVRIANGAGYVMNNNNSFADLRFVGTSVSSSFTQSSGTTLTIPGTVILDQPTTTGATNLWNINSGSATVSGLISFPGVSALNRVSRIAITTGTLNANNGIAFTTSAAATKVIDMSGGAGIINLKGGLSVPSLSSTLTAGTSGSIFNYADNSAQIIGNFSAGAYNNLHINNTSAAGATLGGPILPSNLTGVISVGNANTGSMFSTGNYNIGLSNSQELIVAEGSSMAAGTSVITGATLSQLKLNGIFKTANLVGFAGLAATAISSVNSPVISLGINSIVDYNAPTGSQSVSPFVYSNLTMSNLSGVQTAGGNVTVNGTLNLAAGGFNVAATNLTLNGPAITGLSNSLQASTTSSLTFGGNSTGIFIPASVSSLNNLTLNNTNGLIINADLGIQGFLQFTDGKLTTNANKVTLASTGSINNAGQATGWINGNLQRNFSDNTSGKFEIGDVNYYTPLTLTFASVTTSGLMTAKTIAGEHPSASTSGLNVNRSVNRYWNLSNSGVVFTTASTALAWNAADNDPGISLGNLGVAKYDGGTWIRPTVASKAITSIVANGLASFSDLMVGEVNNPPILTNSVVTSLTATTATLNGSVNDNGTTTTVSFDYGTASDLTGATNIAATTGGSINAGTGNTAVSVTLSSLLPNTTYYFQTKGANAGGTTNGAPILSFITLKADQTITFNALGSKMFGDAAFTLSGTGGASGNAITYISSNTAVATISGNTVTIVGAGNTNITASQAGNANYNAAADAVQNLTVSKKALTIIASAKMKSYGEVGTFAGAEFTTVGLINGNTVSSVTLTSTGTATNASVAGSPYPIVASTAVGTGLSNYTLTYVNAALTISPKPLTITANSATRLQGTANPVFSLATSGFVNGETAASALTTQPSLSTTATTASPQGDYPITISGAIAANDNYTITYVAGTLKITAGAPNLLSLTASMLFENLLAGTNAGNFSATSDDPTATFTYTLVGGSGSADNAFFVINGNALSTNQSLDFETKANYSILVRATNNNGLTFNKQFTIVLSNVNEAPTLNAIANQLICYTPVTQTVVISGITAGPDAGQSTTLSVTSTNAGLFSKLAVSGNTLTYLPAVGASGSATVTVTVKDDGGTANGGIDSTKRSFVVTVNSAAVITIISDKGFSISKGETVELQASGAATYIWSNSKGVIPGQTTDKLSIRPLQTDTYSVIGINSSGCSGTENITIAVASDFLAIESTNIITPNGDGKNDFWVVRNLDVYPNNEVSVFDKAGRRVFFQKAYKNTWDATINGSTLNAGTYYYYVDFGPGLQKIKGYITIVRD